MVNTQHPKAAEFACEVIDLHQRLKFTRLAPSLYGAPAHLRQRHGYTIVAFRHDQAPRRYHIGIMGFRLAQYLRLGWASEHVVYHNKMFWEDTDHPSPNDFHIVALDNTTGSIIGYLGAEFISTEDDPLPLSSPDRPLFPVERAHHINIADWIPAEKLQAGHVMEIKRFVRSPDTPRTMRSLVPLELVLGLMALTIDRKTHIPWVIGDLEMHVALRYLEAFGVKTKVIDGTHPQLPRTDPMWPMYVHRVKVLPFIGESPPKSLMKNRFERIDAAFDTGDTRHILETLKILGGEEILTDCMGVCK